MNDLHDIYQHEGDRNILLGLAEECAELSAAALKLVRAIEGKTPKSKQICILEFLEEFADVECTMAAIANAEWFDDNRVEDVYKTKIARWRWRLKQFDKTGSMKEEFAQNISNAFDEENALKLVDRLETTNDTLRREIIMSDAIMSIGKEVTQ